MENPINDFTAKYSHPYAVDAYEKLPINIYNLVKQFEVPIEPHAGLFVIPKASISVEQTRPHQVPLQTLIFTRDGVYHVLDGLSAKKPGYVVWMPAKNIIKIKLTQVLLYSKLEIWGIDHERHYQIVSEFNTVASVLLAPMLNQLIRKTWENNNSLKPFNPLPEEAGLGIESLSYSFFNGFKYHALQNEEKMLAVVSQPEIFEKKLKIFRHKVTPNTALALTDRQMIILEEGKETNGKYAWIFTYCPAYRLSSIDQSSYKEWQKTRIHLQPALAEEDIEVILDDPHAKQWQDTWQKVVAG